MSDTKNNRKTSAPKRALIAAMAVCMALALSPVAAYADDAASKQAEADTAYASLKTMQTTLDIATEDYNQALLDQQQAQQKMDDAQARIDEQTQKISEYQGKLSTRAKSMYRSGSSTFLDVLLGSTSFENFSTNWDMLNTLNDSDAQLVSQTKTAREEVEAAKQEYADQEKLAEQKATEAKQNLEEAQSTVASMQAVYDSLSSEAATLLQQERDAQSAAAAAAAAAATGDTGTTGGSSYDNGGSSSDSGGSSSGGGAAYEGGGDVVSRAYACLGAPYNMGGVGPYEYDCSGLVSYAITGSHTRLGTTYTFMGYQRCDPYPGCICTSWSHCGIYIGGGQMINASDYGVGVIISGVQSGMIYVTP